MQALELIRIPTFVKDDVLEETVCGISHELGAELGQRYSSVPSNKKQQNYNEIQ